MSVDDAADLADGHVVVRDLAVGVEPRPGTHSLPFSRRIRTEASVTSPTLPRGSPLRRIVLIAASVEPYSSNMSSRPIQRLNLSMSGGDAPLPTAKRSLFFGFSVSSRRIRASSPPYSRSIAAST